MVSLSRVARSPNVPPQPCNHLCGFPRSIISLFLSSPASLSALLLFNRRRSRADLNVACVLNITTFLYLTLNCISRICEETNMTPPASCTSNQTPFSARPPYIALQHGKPRRVPANASMTFQGKWPREMEGDKGSSERSGQSRRVVLEALP